MYISRSSPGGNGTYIIWDGACNKSEDTLQVYRSGAKAKREKNLCFTGYPTDELTSAQPAACRHYLQLPVPHIHEQSMEDLGQSVMRYCGCTELRAPSNRQHLKQRHHVLDYVEQHQRSLNSSRRSLCSCNQNEKLPHKHLLLQAMDQHKLYSTASFNGEQFEQAVIARRNTGSTDQLNAFSRPTSKNLREIIVHKQQQQQQQRKSPQHAQVEEIVGSAASTPGSSTRNRRSYQRAQEQLDVSSSSNNSSDSEQHLPMPTFTSV